MRDRRASIDALFSNALVDRREIDGGIRVRFRDTPSIEQRVRELAEAEARCCAFLSFAIGRDGDALWLEITAAPEARPVIEQFFARGRANRHAGFLDAGSATPQRLRGNALEPGIAPTGDVIDTNLRISDGCPEPTHPGQTGDH
jgi:hypothetical protein